MEVKVLGKDTFKIIRLINKLGIKKEIGAIFKKAVKISNDEDILKMKISIALEGKEETEENVNKVLKQDSNLTEENEKLQDANLDLVQEIVFIILEGLDRAEKETFEVLSSVYGFSTKQLREVPISELIEMVKGIIQCKEFQKVFTNIFK